MTDFVVDLLRVNRRILEDLLPQLRLGGMAHNCALALRCGNDGVNIAC